MEFIGSSLIFIGTVVGGILLFKKMLSPLLPPRDAYNPNPAPLTPFEKHRRYIRNCIAKQAAKTPHIRYEDVKRRALLQYIPQQHKEWKRISSHLQNPPHSIKSMPEYNGMMEAVRMPYKHASVEDLEAYCDLLFKMALPIIKYVQEMENQKETNQRIRRKERIAKDKAKLKMYLNAHSREN